MSGNSTHRMPSLGSPSTTSDTAAAPEQLPEFGPSLGPLANRYELDEGAVRRLRRFASLLVHDGLAPTTVRAPLRVLNDHLADALVGLELPEVRGAETVTDLGAGAGVPGIPLAIALPRAGVALVEGNGRKCEFLRRAVELAGVENAAVIQQRAETWRAGIGSFDVVTARALAPLDVLAEYAAPLLKVGGVLVAWRGQREAEPEAAAARAAAILGLEVREPQRVSPYSGAEHRHLHVMVKIDETPDRFPRRDGVARKRPLGRA